MTDELAFRILAMIYDCVPQHGHSGRIISRSWRPRTTIISDTEFNALRDEVAALIERFITIQAIYDQGFRAGKTESAQHADGKPGQTVEWAS